MGCSAIFALRRLALISCGWGRGRGDSREIAAAAGVSISRGIGSFFCFWVNGEGCFLFSFESSVGRMGRGETSNAEFLSVFGFV